MAASQPYIYQGQDFTLQRDKNRFVLSTLLRGTVRTSSGGESILCLAKHDRWPCLIGFGLSREEEFPRILAEEQALYGKDFDRDMRSFNLYNYTKVPFDGSGRFVLPEPLATVAGIDREIYYQGAGEFFTLWDPEALAAYAKEQTSFAAASAVCASLAAKERAKAKRS
jgi:MraZ protein